MLRSEGLKNLIHTLLVLVHASTHPHVVIFVFNGIFGWEGCQGSDSLNSLQFPWELILDENSTFGGAKVSTTLSELLFVEWLVNDADSGSAVDSDSDHTRDMVEMSLSETPSTIQWIYPNGHILLKELIRELIKVVVGLWRCHAIDLLHLLQI